MFNNILNAPKQGKKFHVDLSCALQLKTEPYWHLENENACDTDSLLKKFHFERHGAASNGLSCLFRS